MNTFAAAISGAIARKARPLQTDGTSQPETLVRGRERKAPMAHRCAVQDILTRHLDRSPLPNRA